MMKSSLFLLVLLLIGCQEPQTNVVDTPPQTTPPAPVSNPEPTPELQKQDPRHKVERVHQLKDLETKKMPINGHNITVWIMDDNSKRAEGMMYLTDKDVKDTEGMLFAFGSSEPRRFWMQNCPLGLDICYLDPKGKVVSIGEGKPFDESGVPSNGSAQYVLELKVGRAKKFGIKPGSVLKIPANVKSKE